MSLFSIIFIPTPSSHQCSITSQLHQKERSTRRHSINVLPFSFEPEHQVAPHLNHATKRVTVDFSLLTVPLLDLLQDNDSDYNKAAPAQRVDANHEENLTLQVFCLTCVTPSECFSYYRVLQIWDL